jgi:hypothetical protein
MHSNDIKPSLELSKDLRKLVFVFSRIGRAADLSALGIHIVMDHQLANSNGV